MRYKMTGGIEQGIHYTTFTEDLEDENQQDSKAQEGATKSHGEKDPASHDGQTIKQ